LELVLELALELALKEEEEEEEEEKLRSWFVARSAMSRQLRNLRCSLSSGVIENGRRLDVMSSGSGGGGGVSNPEMFLFLFLLLLLRG